MNTHVVLPRATAATPVRSTRSQALRAAALALGALALTTVADAQGAAKKWKDVVFRPSTGVWYSTTNPNGGLDLFPQDPSTPSSCELLLPPGTPGALQGVELELTPFDPAQSLALPGGASLEFTAYGEVGGVSGQPMGTLRGIKQSDGGVAYEYDFSALGVSTVTVEFFDGPVLVASYPGVPIGVGPGGTGGGPFFTPNCTCPSCPAHWYCCWLGAVYYSNGVWHNSWLCAIPMDFLGNSHNANRVAVTPENPTVSVGELQECTITASGIPQFGLADVTLDGFTPIGTSYCNANPNSTGQAGVIMALGSGVASENQLDLYAFQLPNNAFGYFIVSPFQAFVPNVGGTQGNLCVGMSTGRFVSQLGNTGANGSLTVDVDLTNLPQPTGSVVVQAGQTFNFQCWHRDANPNVTSNFTAGYSITFQ